MSEPLLKAWANRLERLGFVTHDAEKQARLIFCAPTYEIFLQNLFQIALGRSTRLHEEHHYLGLLTNREAAKGQIVDIVFDGPEARNFRRAASDKDGNTTGILKSESTVEVPLPKPGAINPKHLKLPISHRPLVSVIIPVFEKTEFTLHCLQSIQEHPGRYCFEIILIDDGSADGSTQVLRKIPGIRLICNATNQGFIKSCNTGARLAKGSFLYFLNNDTSVREGWLDQLVDTFNSFEDTAIAGSKLIYPNGRLQEAGAIVWRDASAWNFGRGKDPTAPEFNYARIVDYVSGASLMVRRDFFQSCNGFDERYVPAYCEDSDLCFSARSKGFKVVYQPMSEVVHYEGITSGRDLTSGTKASQVVNIKKFRAKWNIALRSHRPNGIDPYLEKDRGSKGRILLIDACTPTPDQDSGSNDIYNLMKIFVSLGWSVTFIPASNFSYHPKYTRQIQKLGVQALYSPHTTSVEQHVRAFGSIYSIVMLFRPSVTAENLEIVKTHCRNAKIIYNTVDLRFLRTMREAKLFKNRSMLILAKQQKSLELELMRKVDTTIVISSAEFSFLKKEGIKNAMFLPFARETKPLKTTFEKRQGMLFIGGFQHPPNIDAIVYFAANILPLIRNVLPDIKLHIIGSKTPKLVEDLASDNVIVHGFVENIEQIFSDVRVNIAPLRFGAGIKGKVAQALSYGLPTVATPIAAEGMQLKQLRDICIADSDQHFADFVVRLHTDSRFWERISSKGAEAAERLFGMSKIKQLVAESLLASSRKAL